MELILKDAFLLKEIQTRMLGNLGRKEKPQAPNTAPCKKKKKTFLWDMR
jgi:hypothetical protein